MAFENETISAEVILKSISGRSLTENTSITSNNIKDFRPSQETINEVVKIISELGFKVIPSSITITIIGPKSLFEKVFNTRLEINTTTKKISIIKPNKDLTIPESLRPNVERVLFIPPPEYY